MNRNLVNRTFLKTFKISQCTMLLRVNSFIIIGLLFASQGMAAGKLTDYKGYKDPVLFSRIPNYYLSISSSFVDKQFDSYTFIVREGNKDITQRIEGHFTQYCYYVDHSAAAMPSPLQIIRNYQNAAVNIGGQVVYESNSNEKTTLRVVNKEQEIWAEIMPVNGGNMYYVRIVERQAMQQQVTARADALQAGLTQSGHVEVPGIFFDFGKADIKLQG